MADAINALMWIPLIIFPESLSSLNPCIFNYCTACPLFSLVQLIQQLLKIWLIDRLGRQLKIN
jgi:hypothetical protein